MGGYLFQTDCKTMRAELIYGRPNDEYYTPRYAVLPILRYVPHDKVVWCPFDTEQSEYVQALRAHGIPCVHSHICRGQDFYAYEPPHWDLLLSNPPFHEKTRLLERCIALGKPFALLLPNTCLNNIGPMRQFMGIDLQLLMFDRRIEFLPGQGSPFASSYFCRNILPRPLIIEYLEKTGRQRSSMYDDPELMSYLSRRLLKNNP